MSTIEEQRRAQVAHNQRVRRHFQPRIDYMPNKEAKAIFEARKAQERPNSIHGTNSAVLDAILEEWASLTGIKYQSEIKPMSSGKRPELPDAKRARMSSGPANNNVLQRVLCGATRHRDGQPCQAKSEPGKRRCRFHGGRSTGPRTPEGKARALANLRRGAAAGSIA